MSWEDAAATIALARALNMDTGAIISLRSNTPNVSIYQIAPAFVIQQQTGKNFSDVYAMYTGGQTWLQIAGSLNVPANYWNPNNIDTTSWTNDDFTQGVWQNILMKNYGMTSDDAIYFGNQKTPMSEVVVGAVVAREDNTPIRDVMTGYTNNNDWGSIDQQFALNRNNPANQSQVTNTTVTPAAQPAPVVQPAPAQPAPTDATTQTTTTDTTAPATTTETTTTTNGLSVQSATASPVEEWQIGGGNINPYNGWANVTTTTSNFGLSRHHRYRRPVRRH